MGVSQFAEDQANKYHFISQFLKRLHYFTVLIFPTASSSARMRACLEREIFMKRREEQKKRIEKKKRRKREADLARGTPPAIRRALARSFG